MKTTIANLLLVLTVLLITGQRSHACDDPDAVPVARLSAIPEHVYLGQEVILDGSTSSIKILGCGGGGGDVVITKYKWDFTNNGSYDYVEEGADGDDPDDEYEVTSHIYPEVGEYTARLRVVASNGATDDDTCVVYVHEEGRILYVDASGECWGYCDDDDDEGCCDGSSWELAFPKLRDALAVAEYGDTIRVAQTNNSYPWLPDEDMDNPNGFDPLDRSATFYIPAGVTVEGGYAGWWVEGHEDDRDIHKYKTVLSGEIGKINDDSDNSYTVVTMGSDAVLDGFTIEAGNGTSGSGILCSGSSATVSNCVIKGNKASRRGGGMYITGSRTKVVNCFFIDNEASAGGGICNSIYSTRIIGCVFNDNKAIGSRYEEGGAIYNDNNMAVINCTIYGNNAGGDGGGVYHSRGDLTVTNTILWGNADNGGSNDDESAQISYKNTAPEVTYSCIKGLDMYATGQGNIGTQPTFYIDSYFSDYYDSIEGPDNAYGTYDDGLQLLDSLGPQVNTGNNDAIAGITKDPKDDARIIDGVVDIGAYEYHYERVGGGICDSTGCWAEGEAPRYIQVVFNGILWTPSCGFTTIPNEQPLILYNKGAICSWHLGFEVPEATSLLTRLSLGLSDSYLRLDYWPDCGLGGTHTAFINTVDSTCCQAFENELIYNGECGWEDVPVGYGSGDVEWPDSTDERAAGIDEIRFFNNQTICYSMFETF